jgi:hypothetical protein
MVSDAADGALLCAMTLVAFSAKATQAMLPAVFKSWMVFMVSPSGVDENCGLVACGRSRPEPPMTRVGSLPLRFRQGPLSTPDDGLHPLRLRVECKDRRPST